MTKDDLSRTTDALLDEISADPVNWRVYEDHLREVIGHYVAQDVRMPAQLRVYAEWIDEDEMSARFENLPV